MLRLAATVGAMAIHCLAAVDHPDCPPSTCVEYNGFLYRALDGTDPNDPSLGCQEDYLSVPAGWSFVPRDADGRAVAATYVWGTDVIAHTRVRSSTSGTRTASSSWAGSASSRYILKSGETYKPSGCDSRILIGTRSCPRGEGPAEHVTCAPCPEGHLADAGWEPCRPTLTHTLQNLADPRFNIASDSAGIVRIDVEVDLPAEGSLYEKAWFAYRLDVAAAPGGQSIISKCNEQFAFDGASNTFSLVLTYADLNGDCRLNTSFTDTQVIRQGVVAVFLSVTGEGVPGGQGSQWQEPIDVRFPIAVHVLGHLTSALSFFESDSYDVQKDAAIYRAHDVAFVEISLQDAQIRDELVLEVEDVWLSGSADPAQPGSHDLLGSVRIYGGTEGIAWRVRFSVEVAVCPECYIHIRGAVTQAEGSSKSLVTGTQSLLQSASFRVVAPATGTRALKPWVIAAIAVAGGVLLLLIGVFCGCFAWRAWSSKGHAGAWHAAGAGVRPRV